MAKIIENGKLREMTQEELEKASSYRPSAPTPEERIAQLEEALTMLLEGVTEQ